MGTREVTGADEGHGCNCKKAARNISAIIGVAILAPLGGLKTILFITAVGFLTRIFRRKRQKI